MKRHHGLRAAVVGLVMVTASTFGAAASLAGAAAGRGDANANEEKGRELADKFLVLLEKKNLGGLRKFLSPAFQLQRADGSYADKAEYLAKPATVESHQIDGLRVTRVGNVLVVRFDLTVDATIDGKPQSTEPAPRLATFVKGADGWHLVAYANFNVPADEPPQ